MAQQMMCPAHGPVTGESCSKPDCFEPLRPYVAVAEAPPPVCTAPGCDIPHPCPLHPLGGETVAREVAAHIVSASAAPQEHGLQLKFPWGSVTVATSMTIGRDFASDCGQPIETFDNVSRRHARLTVTDDGVYLEDLASTNGTTVNGNPVEPYERNRICEGDILGFGADLRVVVSMQTGE